MDPVLPPAGQVKQIEHIPAFPHAKAAQAPVRPHMLDLGGEHAGCSHQSGEAQWYWLLWRHRRFAPPATCSLQS